MLRSALMACVTVAAFGAPAQAVTYSTAGALVTGDPGIGAHETMVAGFDGGDSLGVDAAHSSGYGLFTGNHKGVAIAPAGDASQYLAIGKGGQVLFDLHDFGGSKSHVDSLSVYLGSIDRYNFIDVFGVDAGGNLDMSHSLLTLGGSDLMAQDAWGKARRNRRLTLDFAADERIGGVMFRSTGYAFEFDSIAIATSRAAGRLSASAVPEPASWAMLVGGFGLVGGAMRRRHAGVTFARA